MIFLQKAIENLLSDRDIKRSGHSELKAACEDLLESVKSSAEEQQEDAPNGTVLPELHSKSLSSIPIGKVFLPFELACQSKTTRMVISSLDTIQKLVAYGHIRYEYVAEDYEDRQFDDHLVTTIANCFQVMCMLFHLLSYLFQKFTYHFFL